MCEFSGRLVAWMDRELEQDEAAAMERHVAACAQCRICVEEFERVSREFDAYCDALAQSKGNGKAARREPILWVAAAAAVVLAAIFAYPRREEAPMPQRANTIAAVSKPSLDSARNSSVRRALDEGKAGTAVTSPVRASGPRALANRVAKRGQACCTVPNTKAANADLAAIARPAASQNANWVGNEPSVQIAISGAAMFPPGALPEGINFVADLSIRADGTVQQVRLQPQVTEFERRSSQR